MASPRPELTERCRFSHPQVSCRRSSSWPTGERARGSVRVAGREQAQRSRAWVGPSAGLAARLPCCCRTLILRREHAHIIAFWALPPLVACTVFIGVFFVLIKVRPSWTTFPACCSPGECTSRRHTGGRSFTRCRRAGHGRGGDGQPLASGVDLGRGGRRRGAGMHALARLAAQEANDPAGQVRASAARAACSAWCVLGWRAPQWPTSRRMARTTATPLAPALPPQDPGRCGHHPRGGHQRQGLAGQHRAAHLLGQDQGAHPLLAHL